MPRTSLWVFVTLIFLFLPVKGKTDPLSGGNNSCVNCHRKLAPMTERAHDYREWEGSLHARKGVTCDKCHGGNPAEQNPQKVHQDVVKSNQPKSPLYFTQIPETCGQCHAAELEDFRKSYHYGELKKSGRGPVCITCHGSMAIRIPPPAQLEQTCSLCHLQRSLASDALVNLNLAGSALRKWEEAFKTAKAKGKAPPEGETSLTTHKKMLGELKRKWHSFTMGEVVEGSKRIVTVAQDELKLLQPQKGGE